MPSHLRIWAAAAVIALAGVAGAEERQPSSPYFDCPYVNYFDSDCPQLERDKVQQAPAARDEAEQSATAEDREHEHEWPEEAPELMLPLFPKESLAPDTPALYRLLLMRPSLENARRYVRWHARRMGRIREVQGLVDLAGREWLAERASGE